MDSTNRSASPRAVPSLFCLKCVFTNFPEFPDSNKFRNDQTSQILCIAKDTLVGRKDEKLTVFNAIFTFFLFPFRTFGNQIDLPHNNGGPLFWETYLIVAFRHFRF